MGQMKFSNNAITTLYSGIGAGATTLNVAPGTGDNFPQVTGGSGDFFIITMEDASGNIEMIRCDHRAAASDTLGNGSYPLQRAYYDATRFPARAWNAGDAVDNRPIAQALSSVGMLGVNNLGEITNAATARTNLGLGSMAIEAAATYQTVAGMSAYQTVAGMSSYQTVSGMSAYQTTAGMSAYVPIAGAQLTGALLFKSGLNNKASAATVDLTAINANTCHITGSTGINGWTMTSGQVVDVVFDGTPLLTHHATNNNLNAAGGNITAEAGGRARLFYDGTTVWLTYQKADGTPVVAVQTVYPPVRQTVLSGPVDSSGYSAFGGSTGSATITATGTLKATASAGGDANYSGSITSPAWTSPGGSGTGYLMLSITSAGVVSTSVRTLPPVYQWGGTYSVVNGQLTYNIQEATMKAGNGSTASQVYEVCVGECPYTSGSWSGSITWYQLMGRTQIHVASPTFAASTSNSVAHKLGTFVPRADVYYECKNAEFGYAEGDLIGELGAAGYGASGLDGGHYCNKTSVVHRQGGAAYVLNLAGGINAIGNTNWGLFFDIQRGW